jgi:GntR family transcriptional regulator/MocR family aminotransferase
MEREWAISSLDLHLDLPRGQRPPGGLRAGLEAALRDAVRTGRLGPGTRLPSSRALAGDLGLARNTVADAYSQLVAEGWLTAERGSGTQVAERVSADPGLGTNPPAPAPRQPARYTLMAGSPDVSAFPRSAWLAATRRALTAAPSTAFGYSHPQGRPELRAALAGYLARARGVRAHPDRIVVCDGFTDGLALLARVLRQRGARTVAVEEYGLPTARATISAAGLGLAAVPVDDHGAVVTTVSPAAEALLLTPAHQFPLGAALAPARRTQAAEWARTTGGLIIEDDYDGEFRYDRQPVGAVQALAPEHVVYAGSASKSLAPGFRLGWLVLPAGLAREVAAARELATGPGSRLDQLILAEFIGSGAYDRHVRRSRLAYRRRQDRLAAVLHREAPQVRVTGVAAGLHALCELPAGQTEAHVVARAAARSLEVDALDRYRAAEAGVGPAQRQALVVGYGSPPEHAFSHAVARLCAALNDPW